MQFIKINKNCLNYKVSVLVEAPINGFFIYFFFSVGGNASLSIQVLSIFQNHEVKKDYEKVYVGR